MNKGEVFPVATYLSAEHLRQNVNTAVCKCITHAQLFACFTWRVMMNSY